MKFPTTPPANRKHRTAAAQSTLLTDSYPLTKSKSHESQLANNRVDNSDPAIVKSDQDSHPSTLPSAKDTYTLDSKNNSSVMLAEESLTSTMASVNSSTTGEAMTPLSSNMANNNSCTVDALPANNAVLRRGRLPTEPGPELTNYDFPMTSPVKSAYGNSTGMVGVVNPLGSDDRKLNNLQVPKSPRTIRHRIAHRFQKTFKMMAACGVCLKPIYFNSGLKCKECKYRCHRECEEKATPSCGLTPELLEEVKIRYPIEGAVFQSPLLCRPSPAPSTNNMNKNNLNAINGTHRKHSQPQVVSNMTPFQTHDSSSNTSSCNSSTPSSPALLQQSIQAPQGNCSSKQQTFNFPENNSDSSANSLSLEHGFPPSCNGTLSLSSNSSVLSTSTCSTLAVGVGAPATIIIDDTTSNTSSTYDQLINTGSSDSDRTPVRVDSQDSQVSDTDTIIMDGVGLTSVDGGSADGVETRWPRQNSMSNREWDIPYNDLKKEEAIGTGRFGTVWRGVWHGDVAIKLLHVDYMGDAKILQQFKMEVGTFRKTRHENLVLFMGACTTPPRLAIVTSLCKGFTLYTHIHLRKDKFTMTKAILIGQQIAQGMGYLHAKGILHKDLKSKNIFLENNDKVIITDFGLFSVAKLCFGKTKHDKLGIPPGWLCYLAPEIIRSLNVNQCHDGELPFSKTSDVYAFGTVWYELLCGDWPFKGEPPESVIWQVGNGKKMSLKNLQSTKDVKDVLMACWAFLDKDREDFVSLLERLKKLPPKRLARSPSHPIHLSRSAESVF